MKRSLYICLGVAFLLFFFGSFVLLVEFVEGKRKTGGITESGNLVAVGLTQGDGRAGAFG